MIASSCIARSWPKLMGDITSMEMMRSRITGLAEIAFAFFGCVDGLYVALDIVLSFGSVVSNAFLKPIQFFSGILQFDADILIGLRMTQYSRCWAIIL
jgi:hypothetical protein